MSPYVLFNKQNEKTLAHQILEAQVAKKGAENTEDLPQGKLSDLSRKYSI